jgi:DNA-directed RNA polymerase subunit RPC12/RpoP
VTDRPPDIAPPASSADGAPAVAATESTAARQRHFACSNCGAEMVWDPADDALACAHCGARIPVPRAEAMIVERALEDAGSAARGFGVETRTATCRSCGAKVAYEGRETATECSFCGTPGVLLEASHRNALRPESVIPLGVGAARVETAFKKWIGGLWLRPDALKHHKKFDAVGVYVPAWTFDAVVDSQWSADAGWYYTVMEPRPVMVNGKMQIRMVPVQKVRWEPAWGRRHDAYDDVLVPASRGIPAELSRKLGGYDLAGLLPYRPEYLAGWRAEEYAVDLESGWKLGLDTIVASQERRCSGDVPGDTQRSLRVHNVVSDVRWKLVLLPVWTLSYRYGGKPYTVLIHGQTGRIVGDAPWSAWKIAFLVLGCLALLVLVLLVLGLFAAL